MVKLYERYRRDRITYLLIFILLFTYGNNFIGLYGQKTVKSINIKGNKKTKEVTILRELTFKQGDTIALIKISEHIQDSKENLLKTSLFNYVTIDTTSSNENLSFFITVEERWYTWPEIYLNHADRNFGTWWNEKDFSKIYYGIGLTQYNFRGRQEKPSIGFITGYIKQWSFTYNNIFLGYSRKHALDIELFFESQDRLEYTTENNELLMYVGNKLIYNKHLYSIRYTYRPKIHSKQSLSLAHNSYSINDTIQLLNNDFLGDSKTLLNYLSLILYYENDHRDLRYYPLTGSLFYIEAIKSGLFNKTINKLQLKSAYYYFFKVAHRLYSSAGLKAQYVNDKNHPYVLIEAFGYDDFLRGFENYVVDGQDFALIKANIKYEILPKKIIHLKFIPISQINKIHVTSYLNFFADFGYVNDKIKNDVRNVLSNRLLYSFGGGIDLVTYYDKSMSIYLAYNSLKEWGYFIHLNQYF